MATKTETTGYEVLITIAAILFVFVCGYWLFRNVESHKNDDSISHTEISGMIAGLRIHRTIHVDNKSLDSVFSSVKNDIEEHTNSCSGGIDSLTIDKGDGNSVTYEALIRC